MREMKDSGVEWIGEIPEDWKITRLKSLFDFGKGLPITKANLIEKGIPVISYGQIHNKHNNGIHIQDFMLRYVTDEYLESNSNSLIHIGDFIFADTSEDPEGCGNCIYVDRDIQLFAGYHTIIFRSKNSCDNRFLGYLFQTDAWRWQIRSKLTEVKLYSVSRKVLSNTTVLIPDSEHTQTKIADYLDSKCSKMDFIIAHLEEIIEKLKEYKFSIITESVTKGLNPDVEMNNSGIEYIGKIPVNYEIKKIKSISDRINVGVVIRPSEYFDEYGTIPFLRGINVKEFELKPDNMIYINEESNHLLSKSIVHSGDILVVRDGAIGVSCVVPDEYDGSNVVSMIIIGKDNRFISSYLCYQLNSAVCKTQFEITKIGSALTHTSVGAVSELTVVVPPVEEQEKIADELNSKCKKIDYLIERKTLEINKIQQYKKSLIYEVVTGKKEV